MKWRAVIFATVALVALLAVFFWPTEWLAWNSFGAPIDVIGMTWFGPLLLLAIPATLCWMSFGAKDRQTAIIGFAIAMVLVGIFLVVMWFVNDLVTPYCGIWQGCTT